MRWLIIAMTLVAAFGCGAGEEASGDFSGGGDESGGSAESSEDGGEATEGGSESVEEEVEVIDAAVGANFLFLLEPSIEGLVRIHAESLEVSSVDLGTRPSLLAVREGTDEAVVLSSFPSQLFAVGGALDEPDVRAAPVRAGYNSITLSPDGAAAVLWFNAARWKTGAIGPIQTVAIASLGEDVPAVVEATVGFEPRSVTFTQAGDKAFVVTREGISILDLLDLDADFVAPALPLEVSPTNTAAGIEVQFSEDGAYAVARAAGDPRIAILDLEAGTQKLVELDATPSDVDIVPGANAALLVFEAAAAMAWVALDAPAETVPLVPVLPAGLAFAQVSPDGTRAVLTPPQTGPEALAIVELPSLEIRAVALQKSVRAATISPTGDSAVLIHEPRATNLGPNPSPIDELDAQIDASSGFSVLQLDAGVAKLFLTPREPQQVTFVAPDAKAYVLLEANAGAAASISEVALGTLVEKSYAMPVVPTAILPMPDAHRLAVAQRHPFGRVSFIDTRTGVVESVTGFQLNSTID
jgi:hypothetical protein